GFDFVNGNIGALLRFDATAPGDGFTVAVGPTATLQRPIGVLVLTPVPLPAGAGLLITALAVLGVAARRRARRTGGHARG
nr:VPLPA-CTERM sorting domain-containing protein [Paracoccaceae bacterium]